MNLTSTFDSALTVEAFEQRLDSDQRALHETHGKRASIDSEAAARLAGSRVKRGLVITEHWCGDSLAIFPVLARLFEEAGVELRIAPRDENLELIDQYLTNGGRAIPILIGLDEGGAPLFRWGPRPAPAQRLLEENRQAIQEGRIDKIEVYKQIRSFYARDAGRTIVREIVDSAVAA